MRTHNNSAFTTYDRDNDQLLSGNCAQRVKGAWWYASCQTSNLNGIYHGYDGCTTSYATNINWATQRGFYYSFRGTEMKLRPASYSLHDPDENSKLCASMEDFIPCPNDCHWNAWSSWTTCAPGSQMEITRNRTIKTDRTNHSYTTCKGPFSETLSCYVSTTDIDECTSNPCVNGGTCADNVNSFSCSCSAGFTGDTCQFNGFTGNTCETSINEYASNPCANSGTCTDDIDECASNPCANEGTCTDGVNSFSCTCSAGFIGDTCQTTCGSSTPEDCAQIKIADPTANSDVYTIKLRDGGCNGVVGTEANGKCCVEVYCDMTRFGGGWTVFQKRFDGSVDFYRNWTQYELGFGSLTGEFYSGNKFLYYFAGRKTYELLVELDQQTEMCKIYAQYSSFSLTNSDYYNLSLGNYKSFSWGNFIFPGFKPASMSTHNSMGFSTYDRDNDAHVWDLCAEKYKGGWWYGHCHAANLNGEYLDGNGCASTYADTITWSFRGFFYSHKGTEMKLRPPNYSLHDPEENMALCYPDFTPVACPNDCHWGPWSAWTTCVSGQPEVTRSRSISIPRGVGYMQCIGGDYQAVPCVPACADSTPLDCAEIKMANSFATSGIYSIKVKDGTCDGVVGTVTNGRCCVDVYCDMDRFGGGWTTFQRRLDGSLDFYRNWTAYEVGFGSLVREFYAGNKFLYYFTGRKTYELLIELDQSSERCKHYAKYSSFLITNSHNYTAIIGDYIAGTAGDAMRTHNNSAFTTYDRDNDQLWSGNCAQRVKGAWWYAGCQTSNLNGIYHGYDGCTTSYATNINWATQRGFYYSFRGTEMKLRPASYSLHDPDENSKLCASMEDFIPCPNDCHWNAWSSWTTCAPGSQMEITRNRTIKTDRANHNYTTCKGPFSETLSCYVSTTESTSTKRTTDSIAKFATTTRKSSHASAETTTLLISSQFASKAVNIASTSTAASTALIPTLSSRQAAASPTTVVPPVTTFVSSSTTVIRPATTTTIVSPPLTTTTTTRTVIASEATFISSTTVVPQGTIFVSPTTTVIPPATTFVSSTTTVIPPTITFVSSTTTVIPSATTLVSSSTTVIRPATTIVSTPPPTTTVVPSAATFISSTTVIPQGMIFVSPTTTVMPPATTFVSSSTTVILPATKFVSSTATTVIPPATTFVSSTTTVIPPTITFVSSTTTVIPSATTLVSSSTTVIRPATTIVSTPPPTTTVVPSAATFISSTTVIPQGMIFVSPTTTVIPPATTFASSTAAVISLATKFVSSGTTFVSPATATVIPSSTTVVSSTATVIPPAAKFVSPSTTTTATPVIPATAFVSSTTTTTTVIAPAITSVSSITTTATTTTVIPSATTFVSSSTTVIRPTTTTTIVSTPPPTTTVIPPAATFISSTTVIPPATTFVSSAAAVISLATKFVSSTTTTTTVIPAATTNVSSTTTTTVISTAVKFVSSTTTVIPSTTTFVSSSTTIVRPATTIVSTPPPPPTTTVIPSAATFISSTTVIPQGTIFVSPVTSVIPPATTFASSTDAIISLATKFVSSTTTFVSPATATVIPPPTKFLSSTTTFVSPLTATVIPPTTTTFVSSTTTVIPPAITFVSSTKTVMTPETKFVSSTTTVIIPTTTLASPPSSTTSTTTKTTAVRLSTAADTSAADHMLSSSGVLTATHSLVETAAPKSQKMANTAMVTSKVGTSTRKVECPRFSHGSENGVVIQDSVSYPGSYAEVICNVEHGLPKGVKTNLLCTENGLWDGAIPNCKASNLIWRKQTRTRYDGVVLQTNIVSRPTFCSLLCHHHARCMSFNVKQTAKGQSICEMLDVKKGSKQYDPEFEHFEFESYSEGYGLSHELRNICNRLD